MTVEPLHEHPLPAPVLGVDLAADGSMLYAACLDGGVYAVDPATGVPRRLGEHRSYASSVHVLPGSGLLISGGYDGMLQWIDPANGEPVRQVQAHRFWSWQSAVSPDGRWVASGGGQYLAGGYDYEPRPSEEPTVRLYNAASGEPVHAWDHEPPVQAVAFSPDSRYLAAGTLMGRIRIWDVTTGERVWEHRTESFTGWGIIKGHYYTGGIHALRFSPDGAALLVCGMGSTTDPAAGNGTQLWERFDWRKGERTGAARDEDIGRGLMEALAWHPGHELFVMAGRLFNGKWNTAIFESDGGTLRHAMDTKMRTTGAVFNAAGDRLYLAGTTDQGQKKDGNYPKPGRVHVYRFEAA